MAAPRPPMETTPGRRPARDLIDAVLENMRGNLEQLKYSTLAPNRYVVYLHPREFSRVEGIVDLLREETQRALAEELNRLNRRPAVFEYVRKLSGVPDTPIRNPTPEWHVEFVCDADGELAEGDVLVDSELVLPRQPDLCLGEQTRRIRTKHSGQVTAARELTATRPTVVPPLPVFARLVYEDNTGQHTYDMTKESITIGRGGGADIRLVAAVDVSREHARIRRDAATGRLTLIDLSSLGTTLNGRHVPRGYDDADGTKRENGAETPLPDTARIGLADTVFLDFQRVS